MNEALPNSEILKKRTEWKTTIFFTQKALSHILEQHSETHGNEKARQIWKIYFRDQQEIENLADIILDELTSEIEYERSQGIYIPFNPNFVNKISHRPFQKNGQFRLDLFEKTPLKSLHSTRIKISNDVLPRNSILSDNIFSHIFL